MTKTISNTLSRWHKIADRIKAAAAEVMQENVQALHAGHNLDGDRFTVKQGAMRAAADRAVGAGTAEYLALQEALFTIRRAMARANTEHGVSDLLNQMEEAKQRANYYNSLLETNEGALTQSEFAALWAKKSGQVNGREMYGVSVTFVTDEMRSDMIAKRDAARKAVNTLADSLADANATKIALALDEVALAKVGL